MKRLSKVRFSRDFFVNERANGNSDFRISKFCHKIKVAKRDADFSMPKKQANEHKAQLECFRKKSLYWENPYFFKWKTQEKNFIMNNFSIAHKKECQKLLWQIAFEKRQKARQKKAFDKLFA